MILRHRASLNGIELDSLDDRILVLGASEAAAKETLTAVSVFGAAGQRLSARHRDTLDVTVRFGIKGPRDAEERSKIFDKISGWAADGGWLTLGHRSDRRLRVICAQLPTAGDAAEWASEYSITFRAYAVPYWQQTTPASVTGNVTTSVVRSLEVGGTAPCPLELSFTNSSGSSVNDLSVSAEGRTIAFTGLLLGQMETLTIDHMVDGLQRITITGTDGVVRSAMRARTPESADEIWLTPGMRQITFAADRPGRLTLWCYGRFV